MIVDMLSDKKRKPIVTELFIRGRKLNISLEDFMNIPKKPCSFLVNACTFTSHNLLCFRKNLLERI